MVLIAAVALMGVVQAADTFVADRCVFLHGLGMKGATNLLLMDVSDITVCLYSSTKDNANHSFSNPVPRRRGQIWGPIYSLLGGLYVCTRGMHFVLHRLSV